jgi:hypothetical protein
MITENVAWIGWIYCWYCNQHGQSCMNLPLTNVGTRFLFLICVRTRRVCVYEFSTRGTDENEAWSDAFL